MAKSEFPTDLDYKIIQFVVKRGPVHKDPLIKKFRKHADSIEYRLSLLAGEDSWSPPNAPLRISIPIHGSSYLAEDVERTTDADGRSKTIYTGIYRITDLGRKALQDHRAVAISQWVRFWIPTAIALLSLIVSALAAIFK